MQKEYLKKRNFPTEGAPRTLEVLDIVNHRTAAKITTWWGVDYILLSIDEDKWMIDQVLWQGPLEK